MYLLELFVVAAITSRKSSSSIILLLLFFKLLSCSTRSNLVVLGSGSFPIVEARPVMVNMTGIIVSPFSSPVAPSSSI